MSYSDEDGQNDTITEKLMDTSNIFRPHNFRLHAPTAQIPALILKSSKR